MYTGTCIYIYHAVFIGLNQMWMEFYSCRRQSGSSPAWDPAINGLDDEDPACSNTDA